MKTNLQGTWTLGPRFPFGKMGPLVSRALPGLTFQDSSSVTSDAHLSPGKACKTSFISKRQVRKEGLAQDGTASGWVIPTQILRSTCPIPTPVPNAATCLSFPSLPYLRQQGSPSAFPHHTKPRFSGSTIHKDGRESFLLGLQLKPTV